jgi:hypothetical protein
MNKHILMATVIATGLAATLPAALTPGLARNAAAIDV